jgi:hypothetical protein
MTTTTTAAATMSETNDNVWKYLDVSELDNYLLSLLVGPTTASLVEQLSRLLPGSSTAAGWLQTISKSRSLQTLIVQTITILVTQGTTPACNALGLNVVVVAKDGAASRQQNRKQRQQRFSTSFQKRILLYTFLHLYVPQIYQHLKDTWRSHSLMLLQQQQQQQQHDQDDDDDDEQPTTTTRIAQKRRQLVFTKLFETIDTITPLLRLAVLLKCWKGAKTSSVAMFLSGLQYTTDVTSGGDGGRSTQSTLATRTTTFFVLYAYRRWVHHEVMKLWPTIGRPLLHTINETSHMIYQCISSNTIVDYWKEIILDIQRKQRQRRLKKQQDATPKYNTQTSSCCLCETKPIPVPYIIQSCGHVACYTCLWNYMEKELNTVTKKNSRRGRQHGTPAEDPVLFCPVCYRPIQSCQPL